MRKHQIFLPQPISPRDFCLKWMGWDNLTPEELQIQEYRGIKIVYANLLKQVLHVSPSTVKKWSEKGDSEHESDNFFPGMPKQYWATLSYALEIKRLSTQSEAVSPVLQLSGINLRSQQKSTSTSNSRVLGIIKACEEVRK